MVFRTESTIVFVLIVFLLAGPLSYKANATDWFAAMKFGLDTAAKAAAQGAFRAFTNKVLSKVQTGGLEGALFVRDWRDFQLKSQHRGEDIGRRILAFAANGEGDISPILCDHIRNSSSFKTLLPPQEITNSGIRELNRRSDSLQEYLVAAKCDPVVDENFDVFIQDFAAGGGWDTFERLLQPQNNIFGATELAVNELTKQRKVEETAALNEALAGKGYIGIRECLTNRQGTSACSILGRIKTPGSNIGEQVSSVFDANVKFYTTADAASLAISALTEFAFGKLFDSGGLAEANTTSSGTALNNENSYKNEFCTAKNGISREAINYISREFPQALASFPPRGRGFLGLGGGSFCEGVRSDDNPFPFERCINACYKAVGLLPDDVDTPPYDGSKPEEPISEEETLPEVTGPCATQEEIDQFLQDNPGDEGRLAEAFPCP